MRLCVLLLAALVVATEAVDPCKRQPFRGRCPSQNGETPKRSQFVLRYYLRNGECVSYPYGHCATDPTEPNLYRYKEECEDACISNAPANLGVPKSTTEDYQKTVATTEAPTTTTVEDVTTRAPRTECERRRASASSSSIRGGFVPACTASGDFERVQCETNGRQCFCVNTQGIEVPNSRTRDGTRPDCYSIQSSRTVNTKECVGVSLPGPCHGSFQRYFYNEDSQKCEQFTYSGCGGNGNNYESREACEDRCAPPPVGLPKCEIGEPLKTKIGVPVNCAKTDCPSGYRCSVVQHSSVCCPENNKVVGLQTSGARATRCSLPKERGPCDKYELRFYFNADLNECKYFFWGGCEGNQNNFERVEDCESACGVQKSGVTNRPNTEIRTTQGIRITPNGGKLSWEETEEDEEHAVPTTTPLAPSAPTVRVSTQRAPVPTTPRPTAPAVQTTTTRASRLETTRVPVKTVEDEEEEEEEVVEEEQEDGKEEPPLHVQPPVSQQNTVLLGGIEDTTTDSVNRCLHPRDSGNCRGQFVRWFFDDEKKNCDVFTYTGCQGNGNNFASKEECMAICHKPEPTPSATPDFSQVCSNDVDAGECNGVFERFAFDAEAQDCRAFTYGGCGGNGNNFATMQECRSRCVMAMKKSPVATCEADIEVGECAGVFSRFAFDKSINACRSFTYGGCGGNANNFATLQECTNKCVNRGVCPEPPACDTNRCQLVNDRSGCPFCSCPPVKQASPPGSITSIPKESLPNCPPLDRSACRDPCMMFHNRQGCEECICPQTAPTPPHVPTGRPTTVGQAQPPASSSRRVTEVGPPAPRTTEAAPPAPSSQPPRQFAVNTLQHQQTKPDQLPNLPRNLAAQIEEKCLQPVEPGPCKNFADRWYFNVDDGTCHPFKYGGCAGNRNHFFTQKECEVHCARFLSGSPTSSTSALPKHAKFSPTTSETESSTSAEDVESSSKNEELEAFPAPKLHRQFASPIFKPVGPGPQAYDSEKIDNYSPPTPNVNLVGLSPPVHPTYFTYNGQDQGQRRAFSAGQQQGAENRIEVGQQLEAFGSQRPQLPTHLQGNNFVQGRGRFDGRQRFEVPQGSTSPSQPLEEIPVTQSRERFDNRQRAEAPQGSQRQEHQTSTAPSEPLEHIPVVQSRGRFDSRQRVEVPQESIRPAEATTIPRHLGDVTTSTSSSSRSSQVSRASEPEIVRPRAPEPPQSRFHPKTVTRTEEVPTPRGAETFGRSTQQVTVQPRVAGVTSSTRDQEATRRSQGPAESVRVPSRAPETSIIGHQVSSFQSPSTPTQETSKFPHRFVTPSTGSQTKTPWYQTTSAPWWLQSPATSKKKPELKIEKLEKSNQQQLPARFNFDPTRYTFYNGDYFGPTIPGIRINKTQEGGLFVQGGSVSEGDNLEAQEAFEQFKQLSKGFQQQANEFLRQEKKAGRTPQHGSFIIGSVKVGDNEGIHDDEDESLEEQEHPRSRAHGVPIHPTVPLVVPTYSSPLPAVRGPNEPVRAAGSKTLEAVKAVETVKQHKEQEPNGISRTMENVNLDLTESAPTGLPVSIVTAAPTVQASVVPLGTTPQPHFEPKFDGRVVCAMPPDAGVCTNYTPRWFFNSQTGQCEQFAYGSCGGNENNFFDRNTCERKCMPHHVILAQVPDRCSFDKDSGSGKGYNVKWYFNMKNLRCEQFVFEGLGGNTNQFETLSECERICTPSGPKTPTLPPTPTPATVAVPVPAQTPKVPQLPIGAPGSQVPLPTPTTVIEKTTPTVVDSQEEEYDDEEEDPIILPETNEMPPMPGLAPANTFGTSQFGVNGLIDDNVELRLPEVATTSRIAIPQVPTTVAPVAPVAPVAQPVQPIQPVQPVQSVQSLPQPAEIPRVVVPQSPGTPQPVVPQVSIVTPQAPQPTAAATSASTGPIAPEPTTAAPTTTETTPLPPSLAPHPPAAHAAKTVIPTYKAEPVLGREQIPTANDGQPIVGASPKETVNYQTGAKASGIRSFDGSQDQKISVDIFNKGADGPTKSINGMPACANGRTEVRYSDGRPVMCLPGKNQCPDGSSCYFNGIDFFCCPEEEDPYDKHAFGGYGGDETKNGYKVFGALNIRRLMDEVPLRQKRQTFGNSNSFNIDSVVAPLRFDAEKPRQVSRALRMKSSAAVPRHGANPLCIQPVVKGSCQEAHLRYYYDRVTDSCRLFEYSGCDGNANNFGSLEDCQRLCVLNIQSIKNGKVATTTAAPQITPEEEEKLAPGQCPGGRAPLGGSSPVLCGNSAESIGCPTSYYCRRGPPDVCCPGVDPKLMQPEEIVKDVSRGVVKNESHMPRGFNRQIFLSTPKYMCPDAADPLMLENGEPMLCGSGFDGVKMCPKGYYCAIDSARNSRLCCPLYGDAQRIASEEIFAPRLASNTETTTEAKVENIDVEESEDDEEEDGEDFVAHLQMKPNKPVNQVEELAKSSPIAADLSAEGGVSIDLGADEKKEVEEEDVTTTTEKMMVQDKSVCQIKPSEGRVCNDSETPTRTNLQYFYSPRDNRCKLFFFRGCGGNLNRFERKSDCEALCL
ncbi:Papilin [Caenorhabditis elegans]|uniref:Papilin n=1 Tax=Caenorhabditis elegans TaxID=6239 RepID=H9G336_CAEEL|nr:Papilin [Caenorhabditis elegans]CCG28205.1 Papilin [Caenorhabditis elegans]|eukprot:NP_001256943.1 Uncharacterized protein CELE_W01F3.3 [Caenorhabditis elegans]